MLWTITNRADAEARAIADRHYNRQKIGATQFVPPGRALVLKRPDAFWISAFPYAQYVKHAWAGAWMCTAFRNEGPTLSSLLILDAVSATRWYYGKPPELGMVTFVDPTKTRHKRDPGRCYRKAGFKPVGETAGGLIALQLLREGMPPEARPVGAMSRHRDYQPEVTGDVVLDDSPVQMRLDDEMYRMQRASGNCICETCGKTYYKHPFTDHRDWNDDPYMNRLCDGRIVKL